MQILHICTKNTVNGNPRRLYVFIHGSGKYDGQIGAVCEEGYEGLERHRKMVEAFTGFAVSRYTTRINVAPKEYRRFITEAKAECIYHL